MAEPTAPDPTAMQNLQLDEVTGEHVSKSELKRRKKDREKEEKKKKQAAADSAKKQGQNAQSQPAEDTAKDKYGPEPTDGEKPDISSLRKLSEKDVGKDVTLFARIANARGQSAKLAFLMLREQGQTIQAVVVASGKSEPGEVSRQMVKWCAGISTNSFVRVTALVQKPKEEVASATVGGLEVHVKACYLVAPAMQMLPMQVKDAERPPPENAEEGQLDAEGVPIVTLNTRLNNRVLDLQTECNQAILDVSDGVERLFCEYMWDHGSRKMNTAKLCGAATEGGSGVFEVSNYFGKKAYLAQSPQLLKQMLIAGDCESVFEIGPVFRAENSNTHRHLTEFTGLDFEMVFAYHYHEVLTFAENLLVHIITGLQKRYARSIATVQKTYPRAGDFRIKDNKALRLTYLEGVKLLKEAGVDVSVQEAFENDLTTAQEKQLGQIIRQKYETDFYVLDEFPLSVRPFYTKSHPTNPHLSNSYDFFMRGEEIMSGAQRINDADELVESMRKKGVDPDQEGFADYVMAFRQGCRKHAGGGLGLNRIVQFFLGLEDVRMATPFSRDPGRLRP